MTNQLIEKANHFLSYFSLNRYVEKPLYELDLNQESMIDYIKRENLYIYLNDMNPLVFVNQVTFIDVLVSARAYVKLHNLDEDYYCNDMNLIEVLLYIEQNGNHQDFINEMTSQTGYQFETFEDILNCLTIKVTDMPVGGQLPVSTFLQAYLCLIDKAKALKESL